MPTKTNPSHHSAFYRITAAIGLSIVASLGLLSVVFAEPIHTRLNPDLVTGGSIKFYDSSPDGNLVAYIADQETQGTDELYIVAIDGGTPTKLSPTSLAGRSVIRFRFTLDSKYLVYSGEQAVDNQYSVYSVPAAGGNSIDLVGELPTGQNFYWDWLRQPMTPDGKWLVYAIEKRESDGSRPTTALRSTPIDQRSTVTLTPAFVEKGGISYYKISPDNKHVFYVADQETDELPELYSVPVTGGAVTKLSIPLQNGDGAGEFYVSPDGTQVVYKATVGGKQKLFRVPSTGGPSVLLNESSSFTNFLVNFSPNGHQLLFATHERSEVLMEHTYKLYIVSLNGGEPVLLSSTADTEGTNTSIEDIQLTPDGSTVFFSYSDNGIVSRYLYSVPSSGGAKTKIIDSIFGFPDNYYFRISQDGKYIVHSVFDYGSQLGNLYRTDLNTSTTITLTGNDYGGPPFYLSPDGSGVFFRSKATQDAPAKIVSVPFTNTTAMTVSVDTSFDVGYSLSIPAPLLHEGQVCQVYTLQNPSRDIYSSCFDAVWKHQVYLPVVAR